MTPPVLLTAPTPLDVRVGVDCHSRHATSTNCDTQRHVALPLDFGVLVDVPHLPSFSLSSAGIVTPTSISISVAAAAAAATTTTTTTTHPRTSNAGTTHDANATLPSDSDCSDAAHAYSDSPDTHADPYTHTYAHTVVQRQWTGAPIRAIVPLPRRMRASPHGVDHGHGHSHSHSHSHTAVVGPPTRSIRDDADADADTDSDCEITIEIVAPKEDAQDEDENDAGQGRTGSRYYSYESITATEGLSGRSFEELRVECYAQSLVARGTMPPPVVQPSLAIPPAFVPRVIPRR